MYVVDDDVSVRESLELLVRNASWQPETFESAREFLARPRPQVPSCVVLDLSLPGISGLDLKNQVSTDRPDMPIIFITWTWRYTQICPSHEGGRCRILNKTS